MQTTPLPKLQVFLTLSIQISEPITAMVIYPFVIEAVRRTGITQGDEKKTGYYAGIMESLFFISESLSVYHIGRASDFYGRKPVLLIGPLGLTLAMLGFGLSKSFWGMALFRLCMGVSNGSIGVSKTVMAEYTDVTNRANAFTLIPIMWTVGTVIGPAIGGLLADPAATWPRTFGRLAFFIEYPWFLPCFAAGLIAFSAFLLSSWGLKETLRTKITKKRSSSLLDDSENSQPASYGTIQNLNDDLSTTPLLPEVPPTTVSLLCDPHLRILLVCTSFLAFTDMAYSALLPLIYNTSIPLGGLGLSPYQIGLILGTYGLFNGVWNWTVLTRLLKRIGSRNTFVACYTLFLLHFMILWVLRDTARWFGSTNWVVWGLLGVQLFVYTATNTAYNAFHLMLVSSAPPNAWVLPMV
ncbi:hypothetical protein D9757_003305 [Collybiopsis confluens]|uniref:Major facilitator superfamily (MFS) profile domain-containing protein n=1 Tax=Collybiopsis confluens TaxID=2823264 RepID=A0A8H5MEY2_9AGAR|nr:hypothetical protein D9757_003305 [Collybiopsis confluens]